MEFQLTSGKILITVVVPKNALHRRLVQLHQPALFQASCQVQHHNKDQRDQEFHPVWHQFQAQSQFQFQARSQFQFQARSQFQFQARYHLQVQVNREDPDLDQANPEDMAIRITFDNFSIIVNLIFWNKFSFFFTILLKSNNQSQFSGRK